MKFVYPTWDCTGTAESGPCMQEYSISLQGKNLLHAIRKHNRSKKLVKKLQKKKAKGKKLSYTSEMFLRHFEDLYHVHKFRKFKTCHLGFIEVDTENDLDLPPQEFFNCQDNYELFHFYKEA